MAHENTSHDHDGPCAHDHGGGTGLHVHGATEGPWLWVSLAVTLLFVAGEAVAGVASHSLALLSDAGHNFTDALALGLAAWAIWVARRPVSAGKTYGYHRAAVLVALFNSATLILIALAILVEAYHTFRYPVAIAGNLMMVVAAVSVVMNTIIATLLARAARHSLNMRAAFVHMAGDALSAVAVLGAGWVVKATGWVYADPLVSVLIAAFILWSSWGIVRDAINILLEGTPRGLDVTALVAAMRTVPQVQSVHDLHVWTVSDGMNYLSCHVEVDDSRTLEECTDIVANLNTLLSRDFGISHATIQTEKAGYCAHVAHRGDLPLCIGPV